MIFSVRIVNLPLFFMYKTIPLEAVEKVKVDSNPGVTYGMNTEINQYL